MLGARKRAFTRLQGRGGGVHKHINPGRKTPSLPLLTTKRHRKQYTCLKRSEDTLRSSLPPYLDAVAVAHDVPRRTGGQAHGVNAPRGPVQAMPRRRQPARDAQTVHYNMRHGHHSKAAEGRGGAWTRGTMSGWCEREDGITGRGGCGVMMALAGVAMFP